MKKKLFGYVLIALSLGVLGGYLITKGLMDSSSDITDNGGMSEDGDYIEDLTEKTCLADDCLLVEGLEYPVGELSVDVQEALGEAINDEYKALSTYEAVIDEFGNVRPFSMIKGSEEQHIALLKTIYDKYGLEVPENTWSSKVTVPDTLTEACQIGVDAEISNVALYEDELIPSVSEYLDITEVFITLMEASEKKHLPAFDKCN